MVHFKPFRAFLPNQNYIHEIICPPYDVIDYEEAKEIAKIKGSKNLIHIIRSEVDFPDGFDPYDSAIYLKAKENLEIFIKNQYFIQEKEEYFYIYELIWKERSQIGFVGLCNIDDYLENRIKKHELTRIEKEEDRFRHIDITGFNCEPVFFMFFSKDSIELQKFLEDFVKNHSPIFDIIDEQDVHHKVYRVIDKKDIEFIIEKFKNLNSIYIADGHHRTASTVRAGLKRKELDKNYDIIKSYNWFLSVVFPSDHLQVLPYNRVVKDLNSLTKEEILEKIKEKFFVLKGKSNLKLHSFHMFLNQEWYYLELKENFYSNDPIENLDVSYLQNYILKPILGIEDPRVSDRIFFVGGIKGEEELENLVLKNKGKIAFSLHPTPISSVIEISNLGKIMPPKSTWFEPKLKSGFFLNKIDE